MKKILSLFLVAAFAISVIGCGSGETKKTETKTGGAGPTGGSSTTTGEKKAP